MMRLIKSFPDALQLAESACDTELKIRLLLQVGAKFPLLEALLLQQLLLSAAAVWL